jgi:hypothetical protein
VRERHVLAVAVEARERADEGVLHRLVGIGWVAQPRQGDAHGPRLVQRHELAEPIAGGRGVAGCEALDFARERPVSCQRRHG